MLSAAASADNGSDICAVDKVVMHVMHPTNAGQPPQIRRIAIESNYALAAWIHGEGGGTAVLVDRSGAWKVLDNSGGWESIEGLVELGVPKKIAAQLGTDFGMK